MQWAQTHLAGNGQGLVQQRYSLGTVAFNFALYQQASVVAASPSQFGL